ncbi:MAG: FGGY family carbohydrate kinase [Chitinophagales bacterium]|nr:FGGY family carbohydrate kinase [Chitinophagales bacterium]
MSYYLAYDVGTSSVKAILVDKQGNITASSIADYPLYMPHPGWVEQVPSDYWNAICKATKDIVTQNIIQISEIKALAFSTQAMGIIPMDKEGNVLHNNISWIDGRAEEYAVKAMRKFGGKKIFKAIVGVEITGKDVIPKLLWLKDKKPAIWNQTYKILDVNGYLKFKCTQKMVAEWSGACSYAFNLKSKNWENLFFKVTGVGIDKLPQLVKSTDLVGTLTEEAARELGLGTHVKVYGGCDDTQAAAVGTTAIHEGEAHIYTGTSAWVGVMTKSAPKFKNGIFSLQSADPKMNFIVGITESAGVNTEWILETFYSKELKSMGKTEVFALMEKELNSTPEGADYLMMTPWFLGERCPVSTTTTRSTLFNLTHQHQRGHIVRAHFEGIAHNLKWSISNIEKDFKFKISSLKITGGGSKNETWMQIIADITNREIITTSQAINAGAIGAAVVAMVGDNALKSFSDVKQVVSETKSFHPRKEHLSLYNELHQAYQSIYYRLKGTYQSINQKRFEL